MRGFFFAILLIAASSLAVLHFSGSMIMWALGTYFLLLPGSDVRAWTDIVWTATPPLILLLGSLAGLWATLLRRRHSGLLIVSIYLTGALLFWNDTCHQRSQIRVAVATTEYWERGGSEHTYFTWWWYNDRWSQ